MKKRLISLSLAAVMAFSLAGCRGAETAPTTAATTAATTGAEADATTAAEGASDETEALTPAENFKIGIITGTASQGDEEITQANKMKEKYGDMMRQHSVSVFQLNLKHCVRKFLHNGTFDFNYITFRHIFPPFYLFATIPPSPGTAAVFPYCFKAYLISSAYTFSPFCSL